MMTQSAQEKLHRLPSHLSNLFRIAKDFYTNLSADRFIEFDSSQSAQKALQIEYESIIIDYLFKNFKTPITIQFVDRTIVNREGESEFTFVILPLSSFENFFHQIRICGYAAYVYDSTMPLSIDSVLCSILANLFTGDNFIAIMNDDVYYNNYTFETDQPRFKDQVILSYSFSSTLPLPTIKRMVNLIERFPNVRAFGSYIIECMMLLLKQVNSLVDLTSTMPYIQQLASLSIFHQVGFPIHTETGEDLLALSLKPTDTVPLIVSSDLAVHKKVLKALRKRI